jgi:hypothetical protein
VAHVARPMRPMYATLYSYPSRVSLINLVHSFQQAGILIVVTKICFCCLFLNSLMGHLPWNSTCIALVHLLLYPELYFCRFSIEYSLHVDSSSK